MVSRSVLKPDKGKNADCLVTIIPEQQHAFLHSNIVESTFHHSLKRMVPLSLQRGKYVISFYFPLFKQSGINYPPTASKDRAVNSMEIKDFVILWTYSQSDDSDGQTESLWGFLSD